MPAPPCSSSCLTSYRPSALLDHDVVYESPDSDSDGSMRDNGGNVTPEASPGPRGSPPEERLGRLSLEQAGTTTPQLHRGRGQLPVVTSKRAASKELPRLPRPPGLRSPRSPAHVASRPESRNSRATSPKKAQRHSHRDRNQYPCVSSGEDPQRPMGDALKSLRPAAQSHDRFQTEKRNDSGYDSPGSRGISIPEPSGAAHNAEIPPTIDENSTSGGATSNKDAFKRDPDKYPGLILQPDSSPISQDQLAAEVKGIYAGLVMVEAKCINIDASQAADPKSKLTPEQWQALIALHRTLLYEHHDFLMVCVLIPTCRGEPLIDLSLRQHSILPRLRRSVDWLPSTACPRGCGSMVYMLS